ncbi:hypothetical protein H9P43_000858 [Blastocladiella emersonii ATCC 22665]|nr:hypothetical protein H9P43_000858 [Blastocladiella emersonii ATCC 22665]
MSDQTESTSLDSISSASSLGDEQAGEPGAHGPTGGQHHQQQQGPPRDISSASPSSAISAATAPPSPSRLASTSGLPYEHGAGSSPFSQSARRRHSHEQGALQPFTAPSSLHTAPPQYHHHHHHQQQYSPRAVGLYPHQQQQQQFDQGPSFGSAGAASDHAHHHLILPDAASSSAGSSMVASLSQLQAAGNSSPSLFYSPNTPAAPSPSSGLYLAPTQQYFHQQQQQSPALQAGAFASSSSTPAPYGGHDYLGGVVHAFNGSLSFATSASRASSLSNSALSAPADPSPVHASNVYEQLSQQQSAAQGPPAGPSGSSSNNNSATSSGGPSSSQPNSSSDGARTHLSSHPFSPRTLRRRGKRTPASARGASVGPGDGSYFASSAGLAGFGAGTLASLGSLNAHDAAPHFATAPPGAHIMAPIPVSGAGVAPRVLRAINPVPPAGPSPPVGAGEDVDEDEEMPSGTTEDALAFRVVGVLPSSRGTSNRVAIFLAPTHAPKPLPLAMAPHGLEYGAGGPGAAGYPMGGGNNGGYHGQVQAHPAAMGRGYPGHAALGNAGAGYGAVVHAQQQQQHGHPGQQSAAGNWRQHAGNVAPAATNTAAAAPAAGALALTSSHEALKEIDLSEFNADSILVRFSTSDSNPNEKHVPGEWKGRARHNELYASNRLGPRIEVTKPGGVTGDKSGFVAFNTLCKAAKLQSLYLASELRDVGLFQGAFLHALWFKVSDVPDRALENIRIAYAWTSDDNITEFAESSELRVIYGPKTLLHGDIALGWLKFVLDEPLEWNGKSNLLVELSKDETHASFSWPATGGLFFKSTSQIRTVAHKDNNDSSGQYPFASWNKPARFRRVPLLAVEAVCPAAYKIVCEVPHATFHGSLVKVDVALDGRRYSRHGATYVHSDPEPAALGRVLADLSRLLPSAQGTATASSASESGSSSGGEASGSSTGTVVSAPPSAFNAADVTFLVGPDRAPFHAHQAILASRSAVFQSMFAVSIRGTSTPDDDPVSATALARTQSADVDLVLATPREIAVPELSPPIFALILQFIYTAAITIPLESACEVLKAAELYALSDLKRSCEEFLKLNTSIENVTTLLLAAERFKVPSVRIFACDFVLWHFDAVSKDPSFARDILPRADLVRELLLARRRGLIHHLPHSSQYHHPYGHSPAHAAGHGPVAYRGPMAVSGANGALARFPTAAGAPGSMSAISNPAIAGGGAPGGVGAGGGDVAVAHAPLAAGQPQLSVTVSFPAGLFTDLKRLLCSGAKGFPDVRLIVGGGIGTDATGESLVTTASRSNAAVPAHAVRVFYAHKVILCSRCEVLEAMLLRSAMREANQLPHTVEIPNIRPAVFESLLSFLYVGRCELTYDNVFELYRAADQYGLDDLVTSCVDFLMQEISVDNVGAVLLDSDDHHVAPIRSFAINLAINEFNEISVTQKFLTDVVPRQDLMLEILQGRGAV